MSIAAAAPAPTPGALPRATGASPAPVESAPGTLYRELVREVLSAFFTVHGDLGFGFADTVYVRAMAIELFVRRLNVAREVPVSMHYKGVSIGSFRAHLVVEDRVVLHITTGERLRDGDRYQLLNVLRCSGKEMGLLLHFGPNAVARRIIPGSAPVAVDETVDLSDAPLQ